MIFYYYLNTTESAYSEPEAGTTMTDSQVSDHITPQTHVRFEITYLEQGHELKKDVFVKKDDILKDQKIRGHEWMVRAMYAMEESQSEEYITIRPQILITPRAFELIIRYLKVGHINIQSLPHELHNELIEVAHYFDFSDLEEQLSETSLPYLTNLRSFSITRSTRDNAAQNLQNFKKLETLRIHTNQLTQEVLNAIPGLLALETIIIFSEGLDIKPLLEKLVELHNQQRRRLENPMPFEEYEKLSLKEKTEFVRSKILGRFIMYLNDAGFKDLASELPKMPSLASLSIGAFLHADNAVITLVPALSQMRHLTSLTIDSALNDSGAQALASALLQMPQLQSLSISHAQFNDADALASALSQIHNLTSFSIRGPFGDNVVRALAPALSHMRHLRSLSIVPGGLGGDKAIQALAPILPNMPALTSLEIRGSFGDDSAKILASILPQMGNLTSLAIKGSFENEGAQALATGLSQMPNLKSLSIDIHYTHVSKKPFVELKEGMPNLKSLKINDKEYIG